MKYFLSLTLVMGFVWSAQSRADFSGKWIGTGTVTGSAKLKCKKISLHLTQTPSEFIEEEIRTQCGLIVTDYDREVFEIRGGELWRNNEKSGTIAENSLACRVVGETETNDFSITLTSEKTANITADLQRGNKIYHLKGTVTRQ